MKNDIVLCPYINTSDLFGAQSLQFHCHPGAVVVQTIPPIFAWLCKQKSALQPWKFECGTWEEGGGEIGVEFRVGDGLGMAEKGQEAGVR